MKPLIQKYQQQNKNVTINYTKMSAKDNYREKLIARSQNGKGPDIFRFHNSWLPQLSEIATYIPSSIMSNAEFEKTFYPIHQKDLKKDNFYYGIPLYVDGLVLIYNETWLKNSGVTTTPSTWDDILDISNKINPTKDSSGNLATGAIALGSASNVEHFSDILGMMLLQNGADLTKLDSQEAAGALETYRFFAEGDNPYWDDSMPNSVNAFIQEKVAMIIAPSYEILTIKKANPEIKIKVVPVPAVPGAGSKRYSIANYWVEGVSRYSPNQLEAWKFLKFLSEKENETLMYEAQTKVRPFGSAYSRVDMASLLAQNNYLGAVIKQAQEDSFRTVYMVDRTYDNGLNDGVIQYMRNAVNATAEGVSYTEALKTAKQGIDKLFSQYKIQ
jgi:multiple sugar transport system substrate-binding protein